MRILKDCRLGICSRSYRPGALNQHLPILRLWSLRAKYRKSMVISFQSPGLFMSRCFDGSS